MEPINERLPYSGVITHPNKTAVVYRIAINTWYKIAGL